MFVIRSKYSFSGKHFYFFNKCCLIQEKKLSAKFEKKEDAEKFFQEIKKVNEGLSFDPSDYEVIEV